MQVQQQESYGASSSSRFEVPRQDHDVSRVGFQTFSVRKKSRSLE